MARLRHRGSCHCGAVRFEVAAPPVIEVLSCTCSICSRTAYLHWIVARADFTLLAGAEALSEYRFGTGVARHLFCRICGIKPFYVPRSDPDAYSVNLRCVDRSALGRVEVVEFDGRDWEAAFAAREASLREKSPGSPSTGSLPDLSPDRVALLRPPGSAARSVGTMEIATLQKWAAEHFGDKTNELSLDYGVARLLVQTGQLGDAVLHEKDVDKEIVDVLFVLLSLANRCNIDLAKAAEHYLYERSPKEILERISG